MFYSPNGLDAGRHEMEYDPVSDKINDMVEDFTHGELVQRDIIAFMRIIDADISLIEYNVRCVTGIESWRYPVDGDLKALRGAIEAYVDKPIGDKK